ncbi:MAG TPA: UDP-glucose 4-epimerase GalE [Nocardioides sp.]|nr:UDP-glucose 4-epimerase GalE [Nocardioides sp.]
MRVLVTGGAGYIGSTVVSALLDAGHEPVVLDDLSTGRVELVPEVPFHRGDVADTALVRRVLARHRDLTTVVHCAARVVVPESVTDPAAYYRTNVAGTLDLAATLADCGVTDLVFSSSASIYAAGDGSGLDEDTPLAPASPYARTKATAEMVLADLAAATGLRALFLRYFNPVGADPLLRTGQQHAAATHVLARLIQAHRAGRPFRLTGTTHPTPDGTAIRDFVHVWDLARAHVAAVERFDRALAGRPANAINLGTGSGTSVRELVRTFEAVVGQPVDVVEAPPRPGDTVGGFARCERAHHLLGWTSALSVADGIRDALAWDERRDEVLGHRRPGPGRQAAARPPGTPRRAVHR